MVLFRCGVGRDVCFADEAEHAAELFFTVVVVRVRVDGGFGGHEFCHARLAYNVSAGFGYFDSC